MNRLRLDSTLEGKIQAGAAWFREIQASVENPFWDELETLADTLRRVHGGKRPGEIPGLEPARRLYRAFGIDPTRTRPSSEALLRRILKGDSLYQVNRVVDAGNWGSLAMLLPVGLYDLDRVEGDLEIRLGHPGECYPGIRKGDVNVAGRLTVADARGAFGSPTSDSLRTSIHPGTTRVLAVVFAPGDFPRLELEEGLRRLSDRIASWCEATEEGAWILGAGS